jgi:hypothetical protein
MSLSRSVDLSEHRQKEIKYHLRLWLHCSDDEWQEHEELRAYESKLLEHLHLEELDWEICFECGEKIVDKALGIHLGKGQWLGSWISPRGIFYPLAQRCGGCTRA